MVGRKKSCIKNVSGFRIATGWPQEIPHAFTMTIGTLGCANLCSTNTPRKKTPGPAIRVFYDRDRDRKVDQVHMSRCVCV